MRYIYQLLYSTAFRITVIYFFFSLLWITLTDRWVNQLFDDSISVAQMQSLKGWFFISVSSILLFWLIRHSGLSLQKSRDYYRDLLDNARVGIAHLDKGTLVSCNRMFAEGIGYTEKQLVNRQLADLVMEEDRPDAEAMLQAPQPEGEVVYREVRLMNSDGMPIWFRLNYSVATLAGQTVEELIAVDVDEKRTYQLYTQLLLHLILSMDDVGDFNAYLKLMLKDLCLDLGWDYGIAMAPEPGSRAFRRKASWYRPEEILDRYDRMTGTYRFESREGLTGLTASSGKPYWIENLETDQRFRYREDALEAGLKTVVSVPIMDGEEALAVLMLFNRKRLPPDSNLIQLLQALGSDIGVRLRRRMEAERKLELEQSFHFALESAGMATWDHYSDNNQYVISDEHDRLLGLSEGESTAEDPMLFYKHVHPDDLNRVMEAGTRSSSEGADIDIEFRVRQKDGSVRWLWSRGRSHSTTDGRRRNGGVLIDITRRIELEENLYREQELHQNIVETIPVMITIYRPVLSDFFVNREFERITGWRSDDLGDVDLMREIYPDESIRAEAAEFMESPGGGWKDFVMISRSGERIDSSWTNIRLSDNTQIGIGLDVTERRRFQADLERERARFEKISSLSSDVIYDWEVSSDYVWWNEGWETEFGFDAGQVRQSFEWWKSIIVNGDRERVEVSLQEAMTSATSFWSEEYRIRLPRGDIAYVLDKSFFIRNGEGDVIRQLGAIINVTAEKELQEHLRQSEEQYRLLFEQNPYPMFIVEPARLRFVEVNRAAVRSYGYSREEFLGLTIPELHPEKEREAVLENVNSLQSGVVRFAEWTHLDRDGNEKSVEISASDIHYHGARCRLIVVNDITYQREMEKSVISSVIEGVERERIRVAKELHDGLAQYISAAAMNLESLEEALSGANRETQERYRKSLDLLRNAIDETRSIARNLMPNVIQDFGLVMAVKSLIEDMTTSSGAVIDFYTNIEGQNLSDSVELNLYRIIQESLNNAIRHGGCTQIDVQLVADDGELICTVEDDGCGFDTADNSKMGMGLISMRNRAQGLSGEIDIQSKQGSGTIISVMVPFSG
ncbi:MAG: PAS domain S-box protein [Balneolaceae bacterium]